MNNIETRVKHYNDTISNYDMAKKLKYSISVTCLEIIIKYLYDILGGEMIFPNLPPPNLRHNAEQSLMSF